MRQRGPWKVLKSVTKYENHWIKVVEDEVVRPDGKPGIYGTIRIGPGVHVLPIDEEGNAYLIREFYYGVGKTKIEAVCGGIENGETPLAAAKRELEEELGIRARTWTALGSTQDFTSFIDSPQRLFLARGLTFRAARRDTNETIVLVKMPLRVAVRRVLDGGIDTASTALLILKAAAYIKTKKR